jgi:hypothetical protein
MLRILRLKLPKDYARYTVRTPEVKARTLKTRFEAV